MKAAAALLVLTWVALAGWEDVRMTEIMFHPSEAQLSGHPESCLEWIELQNTGPTAVTVGSGWELQVVGSGTLTLSGYTTLDPGDYAVIAMSIYWFEQQYGDTLTLIPKFGTATLSNSYQMLVLKYNGSAVETIHYTNVWGSDYGDDNPTPDCDGDGASLERAFATGPPDDPWNWESSTDEASGIPDEDWQGHYESWGTPCATNTVEGQALQTATWGAIKPSFSQ